MPVILAATETGAGSPVVIMHGLFGSGTNWRSIAGRLSGEHRVVSLDLRNHGASPWANSMAYDDMMEDVATTLGRLGLGPVALIGHSMGGKVAMRLALQRPAMVERLVVVDVAPVAYSHTLIDYVRAMRAVDAAGLTRRGDADPMLADAVPEAGVRAFLLQNLVPDPKGGFRWRLNLAAIDREMRKLTGWPAVAGLRYDGPTLFVVGALSDYLKSRDWPTVTSLFPAAERISIPDAGHWLHAEQPEAFTAAVAAFLDRAGAEIAQ